MGTLAMQGRQTGQGMTEYIVIVALIAVAAIATYQFFGQTIRNQTAGIAQEVAGETADPARAAALAAANGASGEGGRVKGLDSYSNNNARGGGGQ